MQRTEPELERSATEQLAEENGPASGGSQRWRPAAVRVGPFSAVSVGRDGTVRS